MTEETELFHDPEGFGLLEILILDNVEVVLDAEYV